MDFTFAGMVESLHEYYSKRSIFTFAEMQTCTRAPCYKGINERPSYFVLTSSKTSGYHDRLGDEIIWYDGYGLKGNQKMIGENLRLKDTEKPLFLFNKEDRNRWRYIGMFQLAGNPKTIKEMSRKVFKFPLKTLV